MKEQVYKVATNCDTRLELQIAHVTITSHIGAQRTNDEVCLSLTDVEGVTLATFLTIEQTDALVAQLKMMKDNIISKCPF